MNRTKFSMNAFLLIILLASGLYLFVSVVVYDMAAMNFRNDSYQLEDTGYYVRYITQRTDDRSGIYDGDHEWSKKLISGNFGYDWGAAVADDVLYCNEYHTTRMGFLTCDVVKIDLNTFEKEVLYKDTMMKGRCKSGELVCMGEIVGANWFPASNPLYKLYISSNDEMQAENDSAVVRIIDPASGKTVWEKRDDRALTSEREEYYLSSELSEVMK